MINTLIIGNGGREHALAWKIKQAASAGQVFVAAGNGGTALEMGITNVDIDPLDFENLIDFALKNNVALTLVGPEAPLAAGIVDRFTQRGLKCLGPTQMAAQLESSKVFCKNFLKKHQIPTATYESFTRLEPALDYIAHHPFPLVIKADGLASGKGVVIAHTHAEAVDTLTQMLQHHSFGKASQSVVIESFLTGQEISFIVLTDGQTVIPLASSQDHKTLLDGDLGPNTGGMGAYSPAPLMTPELQEKVMQRIIYPTLAGMAQDYCPYTGFLYAGLMISPEGEPYVLEYNCRLGDPETQPILMRLRTDLIQLCLAAVEKKLSTCSLEWDVRYALGVVMTAQGYPSTTYAKGDMLNIPETLPAHCKIFHSGTLLQNGTLKTAGGRVLCVTALGDTLKAAQTAAYHWVEQVAWPNAYYRKDIGHKAL